MLRVCNSCLRYVEEDCAIPGVRTDFSKKDISTESNGLFTATGIPVALKGMDCRNEDSIRSFLAAFTVGARKSTEKAPMMAIDSEHSAVVRSIMDQEQLNGRKAADLAWITEKVADLNSLAVERFPGSMWQWTIYIEGSGTGRPDGILGKV